MAIQASLFLVLCTSLLVVSAVQTGPSDILSEQDRTSLTTYLKSLQKKDGTFLGLKNTFYAVNTLNRLGQAVPEKEKICEFAKSNKAQDAESVYYQVSIVETLKCGEAATDKVKSAIKAGLSGNVEDIFYATSAALTLAANKHADYSKNDFVEAANKILELSADNGLFKSSENGEPSVYSTGLALNVLGQLQAAGFLTKEQQGSLDKIFESASQIVSVGEEDEEENTLEFSESGNDKLNNLKVTAHVFKGLNTFVAASKKTKLEQLNDEEIVQLAEFFIQHKKSSSLEDIYHAIEGIYTVAENAFGLPLIVSLPNDSLLNSGKGSEGNVNVRVTDILGRFATKAKVVLVTSYPTEKEDQVLLSNKELTPDEKDQTLYHFNFLEAKPDVGYYSLEFKVTPLEKGKYFAIEGAVHDIKVKGLITVSDVTITVSDSADPQAIIEGKKFSPKAGKSVEKPIPVDHFQHLFVDFKLKSQESGKPIQPHQVFLRLEHPKSGRELIVLTKDQKGHISIPDIVNDFYAVSGEYLLQLIVGDAFIHNTVQWTLATLNVVFPNDTNLVAPPSPFEPKPEIRHQFRAAEKRPAAVFSLAFTGAVLAPFLILFIGLPLVGANLKNFPTGPNFLIAIGFQGTLGAILALFAVFWLKLNMVQTLGYLALLAIPYLFFSHRTLNYLASQRKSKTE